MADADAGATFKGSSYCDMKKRKKGKRRVKDEVEVERCIMNSRPGSIIIYIVNR